MMQQDSMLLFLRENGTACCWVVNSRGILCGRCCVVCRLFVYCPLLFFTPPDFENMAGNGSFPVVVSKNNA